MNAKTMLMIMAGGQGEQLMPLTRDRVKLVVPFAGSYRIIDFALTNCIHSGLDRIFVLSQYKSLSLDRHLDIGWMPLFQRERGQLFLDQACVLIEKI